jgi:hypothetical protein
MFHGMFTICFTICLCISPDLVGYQGTKNETLSPRNPQRVLKPKYEGYRYQGPKMFLKG